MNQCRFVTIVVISVMALLPACEEDNCRVCQEEKCGDLLAYCAGDAGCDCMADCAADGGLPAVTGCLASCGLSARPLAFYPVEECMALACPDSEDECSARGPVPTPPDVISDVVVNDAPVGGGTLADCSFDRGMRFEPDGAILQLESADAQVCVRLERRNDGAGSLANTNWTLLDIRVGSLGTVAHVDDPASMCWFSSHHNFTDWAHVTIPGRHHGLKLREDGHSGARTYTLHTFQQGPTDGTCAPIADGVGLIGHPVALFPVGQ